MMPSDWKGQSDSIDARERVASNLHLAYRKNLNFDFTACLWPMRNDCGFQYRPLQVRAGWSPPTEARFA